MKSTVETLEPTKVRLTIEVDFEELKPSMDHAYQHIASQISIPGFRAGKVPPRVLDQRVGRATVIEHAINDSLSGFYSRAIAENELRPMAQPEIEVTQIPNVTGALEGTTIFTAEVDIVPAFEVPEVDESTVIEVETAEVSDDDVQAELDELRGRFASLKAVKRQAKTGDYVTIDLKATVDGEEVDSVTDVSYEIGSGTMLDGQDKALRGTKSGEDVTFTSTLKGGEREGEEAEVTLHIQSVKARELPKADDDFAQMVSEFDTIDELMADLREQAGRTKKSDQALQARDRLIKHLVSGTEILLPASVVDHEVSHRVGEDANAKARKDAREEIEADLREELLMDTLAQKRDVQVSQQELIDYMIQMSQNYGMDINQLFGDNNQVQSMVQQLGRTKALIEVLRTVTVKDTEGNAIDLTEFFGDQAKDAAADETEADAEDIVIDEVEVEVEADEVDEK